MIETVYRAKAGLSEWSIHLWRNNGHDIYSRHQTPDPAPELEEAQVATTAELRRLEEADSFAGDDGHWWADLQYGTWQPIKHHNDGLTVYDATWEPSGRHYTGHIDDEAIRWEEL